MSRPTHIGTFRQGERPEPLVVTFTDDAGTAINLTGFTARAVWRLRSSPQSAATTDTPTITTAASGIVTYSWDADNTASLGMHVLEIWVGNAGTLRYASRLFTYYVEAGVGSSAPSI